MLTKVRGKHNDILNTSISFLGIDRVEVLLVLNTGLIIRDYSFDNPIPDSSKEIFSIHSGNEWVPVPNSIFLLDTNELKISFEKMPDRVIREEKYLKIFKTKRTIKLESDPSVLRKLATGISEGNIDSTFIHSFPMEYHASLKILLNQLIHSGALIDKDHAKPLISHEWSIRGGSAEGKISREEIEELTFHQEHYDLSDLVTLNDLEPLPFDSLSQVLKARRSNFKYNYSSISIDDLSQLLGHACGITGEITLKKKRKFLRAYPSPGALYAANIFVIPTRVEDLDKGIYQYIPEKHALKLINNSQIDISSFCLPDVRTVVEGTAAFIAITINLSKAVAKYGDVTYRILLAESGCIAENIVLVAHSLGLRAGPFTGVFDSLIDNAINLPRMESRFTVGVLLGHES